MASIQPRGHTPRCVACDLWQGLPKGSHRRLSQVLFLGFHRMGRATSPRRWPASASASSLAPQRSIRWKAAQRRPHHRSCEGKGARFLYKLGENSTKTDETDDKSFMVAQHVAGLQMKWVVTIFFVRSIKKHFEWNLGESELCKGLCALSMEDLNYHMVRQKLFL